MSGLKDKTVTMAHGAGGRQTSELIDQIFAAHFANPDPTGRKNGSFHRWIYCFTGILSGRKYWKTLYLRNS